MKGMLDKTPHGPDPDKLTRLPMQIRPALDGEHAASDRDPDTLEISPCARAAARGFPSALHVDSL
jgi:hypothetical protein